MESSMGSGADLTLGRSLAPVSSLGRAPNVDRHDEPPQDDRINKCIFTFTFTSTFPCRLSGRLLLSLEKSRRPEGKGCHVSCPKLFASNA